MTLGAWRYLVTRVPHRMIRIAVVHGDPMLTFKLEVLPAVGESEQAFRALVRSESSSRQGADQIEIFPNARDLPSHWIGICSYRLMGYQCDGSYDPQYSFTRFSVLYLSYPYISQRDSIHRDGTPRSVTESSLYRDRILGTTMPVALT